MRQHHKRTILTTFRYIKYTNLKKRFVAMDTLIHLKNISHLYFYLSLEFF